MFHVDVDALKGEAIGLLREKENQTWPILPCLAAIVLPVIVFVHVSHLMCCSLRFHSFYWAMVAGPLIGLAACVAVSARPYSAFRLGKLNRKQAVLALSFWFAFLSSLYLGEQNFRSYAWPYYSYQDLALYTNIDPSRDKGQSYMDAGQVYFKESATVLTSKAIAYQNAGIYCVAPIVRQPIENQGTEQAAENSILLPEAGTIDFWAVGQDCCDSTGQNFKCGAIGKPFARSGLRMLRDDVRPFYYMAVQEWNAWLGMPSKHPLFFHWVEDPITEVDLYLAKTNSTFWMNICQFLGANIALALLGFWALQKTGMP
eukprot:TRINITY_DN1573_c0_g1_i2.p1 TRINITY_DN1573_c0_g1~~TRINITY_DN1573_c0_g1_i2.p1  ORF type:complete len:315 (-),score=48.03 TRINITY_DN1573_c0_g1_i2:44-988(-)